MHYIIKLVDQANQEWYLDYSVTSSAPLTTGMTLDELKAYWAKKHYGSLKAFDLPRILTLVESRGSSCPRFMTLEELVLPNEAGPGGTSLSLDEMTDLYCIQQRCIVLEEHVTTPLRPRRKKS